MPDSVNRTGVVLSGRWEGVPRLMGALRGMERSCQNLAPLFERVIDGVLRPELEEQFALEGRGWPRLNEAYARRKRRLYGDKPILQAEGTLYEALTGGKGTAHQIRDVRADGADYGTTLNYALVHQRPRPTNPLPMRQIFADESERGPRSQQVAFDHFRGVGQAQGFEVV